MVPENPRERPEHGLLEQVDDQEIRVELPIESFGRDAVPHLAHTRKTTGQRASVRRERLLGRRFVVGAVDPYRPEQGIAGVFLESPSWFRTAIRSVIDIARPAVVGPGGDPELDVGGNAPRERDEIRARRRKGGEVV